MIGVEYLGFSCWIFLGLLIWLIPEYHLSCLCPIVGSEWSVGRIRIFGDISIDCLCHVLNAFITHPQRSYGHESHDAALIHQSLICLCGLSLWSQVLAVLYQGHSSMVALSYLLTLSHMGQVTKVCLSCYLILIAKPGNKTGATWWPDRLIHMVSWI